MQPRECLWWRRSFVYAVKTNVLSMSVQWHGTFVRQACSCYQHDNKWIVHLHLCNSPSSSSYSTIELSAAKTQESKILRRCSSQKRSTTGPVSEYFKMFAFQSLRLVTCVWMVFVLNATLFTTYLLILSYQLTLQGPRRGRGWGGLSPLPPSLFCKNKNKLSKNYLTKITEPK